MPRKRKPVPSHLAIGDAPSEQAAALAVEHEDDDGDGGNGASATVGSQQIGPSGAEANSIGNWEKYINAKRAGNKRVEFPADAHGADVFHIWKQECLGTRAKVDVRRVWPDRHGLGRQPLDNFADGEAFESWCREQLWHGDPCTVEFQLYYQNGAKGKSDQFEWGTDAARKAQYEAAMNPAKAQSGGGVDAALVSMLIDKVAGLTDKAKAAGAEERMAAKKEPVWDPENKRYVLMTIEPPPALPPPAPQPAQPASGTQQMQLAPGSTMHIPGIGLVTVGMQQQYQPPFQQPVAAPPPSYTAMAEFEARLTKLQTIVEGDIAGLRHLMSNMQQQSQAAPMMQQMQQGPPPVPPPSGRYWDGVHACWAIPESVAMQQQQWNPAAAQPAQPAQPPQPQKSALEQLVDNVHTVEKTKRAIDSLLGSDEDLFPKGARAAAGAAADDDGFPLKCIPGAGFNMWCDRATGKPIEFGNQLLLNSGSLVEGAQKLFKGVGAEVKEFMAESRKSQKEGMERTTQVVQARLSGITSKIDQLERIVRMQAQSAGRSLPAPEYADFRQTEPPVEQPAPKREQQAAIVEQAPPVCEQPAPPAEQPSTSPAPEPEHATAETQAEPAAPVPPAEPQPVLRRRSIDALMGSWGKDTT